MAQERMDIREHIRKEPLVFDGGMGTYYAQKTHTRGKGVELANIETPLVIEEIHTEYLRAGAQAIKTNTFAANRIVYQGDTELVARILRAGWELAVRAAKPFGSYVFADIGPVTGLPPADILEEYRFLTDTFLAVGARHFLFETNSSTEGLVETAAHIKQVAPDAFVLTSFSAFPGGYTRDGFFVEELVREVTESGYIDAVGFNCVSGVRPMKELVHLLGTCALPVSLMPNAGHPIVIDGRTFYESAPDYFGTSLAALVHDVNARALLEARQGLLEALPLRAGQGGGDCDGAARPVLGRVSGEDLAGAEVGVMVVRPAAGGQARTGQRQDGGERKRAEGMSEQ